MSVVLATGRRVANVVEGIVGENSAADIKETIMDPNTRTLIRVSMADIENDAMIMQILRGGAPSDVAARRQWMQEFEVTPDMIDT